MEKKQANLEHVLFLGSNNASKYFSQRLHHTQESSIPKSFQRISLQTETKHTLAVDKTNWQEVLRPCQLSNQNKVSNYQNHKTKNSHFSEEKARQSTALTIIIPPS